jgi:hypothetical protein
MPPRAANSAASCHRALPTAPRHATARCQQHVAGLFTLLVRCLIGAVFLSKMKETISNCASPQREPFLRAFAIAGACFFFALPLLALLLFLFANNCSIARNLTLIAGLSQVCCSI